MVKMRALQTWKGQEGKVYRGDVINVSEPRAKQLEGYETSSGRVITLQESEAQAPPREVRRAPRAERIDEPATTTKGGATADDRQGQHGKAEQAPEPPPGVEPDATEGAQKLAQAHGVSLRGLTGTGKEGRIVRADVLAVYGHAPADE